MVLEIEAELQTGCRTAAAVVWTVCACGEGMLALECSVHGQQESVDLPQQKSVLSNVSAFSSEVL